jgi:hypothetical protein
MTQHQITNAEYAAAIVTGQVEAEEEVRARAVRYVPDRDAIEIVTTRNAGFLIPREWIGALQDVPTEDLAKLDIWPDGSAIELEDRDIHISVLDHRDPARDATTAGRGGDLCKPRRQSDVGRRARTLTNPDPLSPSHGRRRGPWRIPTAGG